MMMMMMFRMFKFRLLVTKGTCSCKLINLLNSPDSTGWKWRVDFHLTLWSQNWWKIHMFELGVANMIWFRWDSMLLFTWVSINMTCTDGFSSFWSFEGYRDSFTSWRIANDLSSIYDLCWMTRATTTTTTTTTNKNIGQARSIRQQTTTNKEEATSNKRPTNTNQQNYQHKRQQKHQRTNWLVVSNIFNFHPENCGNDPIWLCNIFQMGWFNHKQTKSTVTCSNKKSRVRVFAGNLRTPGPPLAMADVKIMALWLQRKFPPIPISLRARKGRRMWKFEGAYKMGRIIKDLYSQIKSARKCTASLSMSI